MDAREFPRIFQAIETLLPSEGEQEAFFCWLLRQPAELRAWRLFGAKLAPLLDRILAAHGDHPDPQVLRLQHTLAELLTLTRPSAPLARNTSEHNETAR